MKRIEFKGNYVKDENGDITSERNIQSVSHVVIKGWGCNQETHKPYGFNFELIDMDNNQLFDTTHNVWEIEDRYESYWNRLNDLSSGWRGEGIVKVIDVYSLEDFMNKYDTPTKREELLETIDRDVFKSNLETLFVKGEEILKEELV